MITGKSMVSAAMNMHPALQAPGIQCPEADTVNDVALLDHETPSHAQMPAFHKKAGQVASLFHDTLDVENTKDDDPLVQTADRLHHQKNPP